MNKKPRAGSAIKLFSLAKPYLGFIFLIFLISLASNGLNLVAPKIIASAIDAFRNANFDFQQTFILLGAITLAIFIFSLIQSLLQTYLSEKIGRDLRTRLITKISNQPFSFINEDYSGKITYQSHGGY